jgi:hypothetical protein
VAEMYFQIGLINQVLFGWVAGSVFFSATNHLDLKVLHIGTFEIVLPLLLCVSIINAVLAPVIGLDEVAFVSSTSLLLPDMKIG